MRITVSFTTNHDLYGSDPVILTSRKRGFGVPFGYQPQGQADLDWETRREALTVAAQHGVPLTER